MKNNNDGFNKIKKEIDSIKAAGKVVSDERRKNGEFVGQEYSIRDYICVKNIDVASLIEREKRVLKMYKAIVDKKETLILKEIKLLRKVCGINHLLKKVSALSNISTEELLKDSGLSFEKEEQ